jgi:hypothetical protein
MKVVYNTKAFMKEMNNLLEYSSGFVEGVQLGKNDFLSALGATTVEVLKQYIDSNARANPDVLHHIYEWYEVGSPQARLFDIKYTVSSLGISFVGNFSQSKSIKNGSTVPFYDKANIIENGIPVVIRPNNAQALVFEENGEKVFVKSQVTVQSPGGEPAQGGFERVMDSFFTRYFTQAFLESSGILNYIRNPVAFKANLRSGKRGGKSKGLEVGKRWIVNAAVGVVE